MGRREAWRGRRGAPRASVCAQPARTARARWRAGRRSQQRARGVPRRQVAPHAAACGL